MSTTSSQPTLSIIIVTWNVRELTLACLDSIERTKGELDLEVIVVDNDSTDGTVEAIRRAYPETVVVANEVNLGFPRANNQALRIARGRYILFLNPDTVVGPGTLEGCVEVLEGEPGIGMVGCRLIYPDGSVQYECARRAYRLRHLLVESVYLHMFFPRHPLFAHHLIGDWDHLDSQDVEAISGAFMMVRRELALEIGGLPEEHFMYHEDLAFCLRIRARGQRIRYLAEWETTHFSGQSSGKSASRLDLLEGAYKIDLIRELEGPLYARLARLIFGVRSVIRLGIAGLGHLLGFLGPVRRARLEYPKVFDPRLHLRHLAWSISPRLVAHSMPRPEGAGLSPAVGSPQVGAGGEDH